MGADLCRFFLENCRYQLLWTGLPQVHGQCTKKKKKKDSPPTHLHHKPLPNSLSCLSWLLGSSGSCKRALYKGEQRHGLRESSLAQSMHRSLGRVSGCTFPPSGGGAGGVGRKKESSEDGVLCPQVAGWFGRCCPLCRNKESWI